MDYLLAVTLFAISSSVTPGPNNIMVMTSGVNFGVQKSLPLLIGSVDLSSSFLQQFDWLLYKAEAAWHSYSM